jgi:hypothetical protein
MISNGQPDSAVLAALCNERPPAIVNLQTPIMRSCLRPYLPIFGFLIGLASCHKHSGSATDNDPRLVGSWMWIGDEYDIPVDSLLFSRVSKSVTFYENGDFTITHNDYDSIDRDTSFDVIVIPYSGVMTSSVEAKGTWQTGTQHVACAPSATFPGLNLYGPGELSYQYAVTGDTLTVVRPPCLAPLTSVYIRSN